MSDNRRVQFSIRLSRRDKERFSAAAESCGLDPSAAARQLIELVVQRVDAGGDLIDALHELKSVWDVPKITDLERRLDAISAALANFEPPADPTALVDKIEAVEREMLHLGRKRRA